MKKTLGLAVAEEVGIVRERMRAAILFLALDTKVCDAIQQDDIGLLTHTSVMLKQKFTSTLHRPTSPTRL